MRILHYSLGLPPYRSGGMTAWSVDLMQRQLADGVGVVLLYPADMRFLSKEIKIKKTLNYDGIQVFKLLNPLPIPLIYGIDSVKRYVDYKKPVDFDSFFEKNKFDAVHLHTLMGLPLEFLQSAKKNNVKLLYTAHDMFGVWPEPALGREKYIDPIFNLGYIGNQAELSSKKIFVMQSSVYRLLKNSIVVKKLKGIAKRRQGKLVTTPAPVGVTARLKNTAKYDVLRKHYAQYFYLIDEIHFNSELARDIFSAYGLKGRNFVSYVYHSSMNIRPKRTSTDKIVDRPVRLLYNGTREQYKGYELLLGVLDKLYTNGFQNFQLIVYGNDVSNKPYIRVEEPYTINQIDQVYSNVDVTVVPSLYYETFGMVVAESLSYGVPVIASSTVGAGVLLGDETYGGIFSSKDELRNLLVNIFENRDELEKKQKAILKSKTLVFDANKTYADIQSSYKRDKK